MTVEEYLRIKTAIINAGYGREVDWSQNVEPPETPEQFASEAIWVILCSGMKEQIARKISDNVWAAIRAGKPVSLAFGHAGKAAAIQTIWDNRASLHAEFRAAPDPVEYCACLPWIGNITKWHLAKNYGVDCAKPDVHLMRIAARYQTTPADLCAALAKETGDRIATVDLVIWRACNLGIINSRSTEGDPR